MMKRSRGSRECQLNPGRVSSSWTNFVSERLLRRQIGQLSSLRELRLERNQLTSLPRKSGSSSR
jgi:hypothetical protein